MRDAPSLRRPVSVLVLALVLGLLAGFAAPRTDLFALKKNFAIFGKLYEELATGYVEEIDPERLMRAGIDAMLSTLDPYTVFIDETDSAELDILTRGRYGGVGLSIGQRAGEHVVLQAIEGYSASEQGLRTGDVIRSVDGVPVRGLSSEELSALLRGEPGTTVDLVVEREGAPAPLEFTLTRQRVQLRNVTYAGRLEGDVGYVRLERFTQGAAREVREALERLRRERPLAGLVLDLRGNPGGLLEEAVGVAGLFLPARSVVVSTRGRTPESERVYRSDGPPAEPSLPLVVLVDGASASASEIVAGALQDHDRAVLVGAPTFGKGLVQTIRPLPHNTALKLTVSQYFIPSGRSIQAARPAAEDARIEAVPDSLRRAFRTRAGRTVYDGMGVEPDVPVDEGEVSELEEALVRRAAFFLYANHYAATHDPARRDFAVTDEDLRAFRAWLARRDFAYTTRAEHALEALEADLRRAGYTGTTEALEALRRAVRAEKEADFERHAPRLKQRLRREILARSLSGGALVEASFRDDAALARAQALLAEPAAYRALLAAR